MKAGAARRRAAASKRVSSPTRTCSGKPPMRSQRDLVKAIDRAVQDFVGAVGESLMEKNGAEATSQTVESSGSTMVPPRAYSAEPARSGAVRLRSQSGA